MKAVEYAECEEVVKNYPPFQEAMKKRGIEDMELVMDGKTEAEVKLTGILSLGALQPVETRKYGLPIAPGLYAPVHQHLFVTRKDIAVDCKPGEAYNQIGNTRTVNRTGQLTGYKLIPGSNCLTLAGSEAKFLRRAEFLKHNLWITPYALDENFPGGEFPTQIHVLVKAWPRGSNKIVLLKKVIASYGMSSISLVFQR